MGKKVQRLQGCHVYIEDMPTRLQSLAERFLVCAYNRNRPEALHLAAILLAHGVSRNVANAIRTIIAAVNDGRDIPDVMEY